MTMNVPQNFKIRTDTFSLLYPCLNHFFCWGAYPHISKAPNSPQLVFIIFFSMILLTKLFLWRLGWWHKHFCYIDISCREDVCMITRSLLSGGPLCSRCSKCMYLSRLWVISCRNSRESVSTMKEDGLIHTVEKSWIGSNFRKKWWSWSLDVMNYIPPLSPSHCLPCVGFILRISFPTCQQRHAVEVRSLEPTLCTIPVEKVSFLFYSSNKNLGQMPFDTLDWNDNFLPSHPRWRGWIPLSWSWVCAHLWCRQVYWPHICFMH